jgi:tetratricopeptide (TPR) repeat protein
MMDWGHRFGCMRDVFLTHCCHWRRAGRFRRTFVLLLSALLCASASLAGSAAKPREVTSVDAIRHFMEKGQSLFVAARYVNAAEVFEAGFELHHYSAFKFNAAVALEKAERFEESVQRFKEYLDVDASAPDRAEVQKRIERLEQLLAARKAAEKSGKPSRLSPASPQEDATKSLVVVETEPQGATIHFFQQLADDAQFAAGDDHPGFKLLQTAESAAEVSLDVGKYHIVVDRFGNFNPSEADLEVLPGHVHQLKLNLSQGAFMAYLRVEPNPKYALTYVDDPKREKPAWAQGTHGELIPTGLHQLLVVAPGFQPYTREIKLTEGQKEDISVRLERVEYGVLRFDSNAPMIHVTVDGRPVGDWSNGSRALDVEDLRAGSHQVWVTAPGRKPVRDTVTVPKGQVQPVHAHMVVTPPRGAAWTQAIISGVLVGTGVYLGLESNRLYSELHNDRSAGILVRGDSRESRGKWFSVGADVAFLGGAGLGGLAAYSFVRDPLPPSQLQLGKLREFASKPAADRGNAP